MGTIISKDKKTKIMYVVGSLAKTGGTERVLIDKMNYLSTHGFEVVLITYEQGTHSMSFPVSPSVKHIDTGTRFFTLYKYHRILRIFKLWEMKKEYFSRLQNIVDFEMPDFIITTTYHLDTCGIVTQLKTTAKLIVEAHIPKAHTYDRNIRNSNYIKRFLYTLNNEYRCKKARKFDLLVALTPKAANDWKNTTQHCIVIPNPVTKYQEVIKDKIPNTNRIIAAGRLTNQKGFERLIYAFAQITNQCPEWHIDIFGDGDDKQYLNDCISKGNLQNKVFIHPSTSHIYDEYMNSDFYVMSSRYEGLPLVLIEAMSCGLPCVSFRCKYGPEDIIEDGKTGLLVKDGDIKDLAQKILWMCQHEEQRIAMSISARKSAEKYKKEHIMPIWIKLFNDFDSFLSNRIH